MPPRRHRLLRPRLLRSRLLRSRLLRSRLLRSRLLRSRLLRLGVLAALVLALGGCGTVDHDDLLSYTQQIESDAAEGALLAGTAARSRAPVTFVWLHSAELHHHVQDLAEHMQGEMAAPATASVLPTVEHLAGAVTSSLELLHADAGEPTIAAQVHAALLSQASVAEKLADKLQ